MSQHALTERGNKSLVLSTTPLDEFDIVCPPSPTLPTSPLPRVYPSVPRSPTQDSPVSRHPTRPASPPLPSPRRARASSITFSSPPGLLPRRLSEPSHLHHRRHGSSPGEHYGDRVQALRMGEDEGLQLWDAIVPEAIPSYARPHYHRATSTQSLPFILPKSQITSGSAQPRPRHCSNDSASCPSTICPVPTHSTSHSGSVSPYHPLSHSPLSNLAPLIPDSVPALEWCTWPGGSALFPASSASLAAPSRGRTPGRVLRVDPAPAKARGLGNRERSPQRTHGGVAEWSSPIAVRFEGEDFPMSGAYDAE